MKRFTLCVLLVLAATMALATTADKDLYIPAVARAQGAFGTFWSTDVRIYNPNTATLVVTVTYLPMAAYAGDATSTTVSVSALETLLIENILETRLGIATNTAGALHLTAAANFMAESRTFTPGATGTYGQRIPGIPASQAVATGESVDVIYIDNSADFRTNFGIVDAGGTGVGYNLTAYNHMGDVAGTYSGTVGAGQWDQFNPLDKTGAGALSNARVMFTVTSGKAMPYASQVDNASGDPIFIDGTKIKGGGGGTATCGTGLYFGYYTQYNNGDWEGYISNPGVWAVDDFNLWSVQDPTPADPGNEDDFGAVYITPTNYVMNLGFGFTAADPSEYIPLTDGAPFDFSIEYSYTDGTNEVLNATYHWVGTLTCNYFAGDMDALVKALKPDYKDFAGKWYWHFAGGMQ
jgi:hypothetical protein